ncbi:hypothetical protein HG263_00930 [Pseudoalteromonas sp. JBTF-M23]|uniref:Uncharacterized protein n=1 Tax=Pseudoalteromonas caenipelagi TaxID=2726988 RepID=A0A849V8D4_9GAMM|nr:DUF6768 family protein [Pseudoalteromonas caenipelagi]NOU49115.1 hypothetical protein [Pseudoalteromonas caenipelagi]
MNIDEKIKASLTTEQHHLDTIMSDDRSLFNRLSDIYQGSMRVWVILSSIAALIITFGFVYAGYQFCIATTVSLQVFWGVWFIVGLLSQIAIKLWLFMEMNRVALLKEIKRSELNILSAMSQQN